MSKFFFGLFFFCKVIKRLFMYIYVEIALYISKRSCNAFATQIIT